MNRQQLPRIRLKVATNAGINILCTALRTWKVVQWLPYIEQAYRQVKEDQQDDQDSKKRFIKAIRIKKGNFYIANSQLIGDIFQDNDEVQCEITFPQIAQKKKKKREKIIQKQQEKAITKPKQVFEDRDHNVLNDKQSKHDQIKQKEQKKKVKPSIQEPKQPLQLKQIKPKKASKKPSKQEKPPSNTKDGSKKDKLMNKIDFSKLISLIHHPQEEKTKQLLKKVQIESQSQEQQSLSQSQ